MTREEFAALAFAEMALATWTPDKVFAATRDGYKGEPYDYTKTHNYKAQVALYNAVHAAPTTVSPLAPVQSVLILADDPWGALEAPPHYQFWITADYTYRPWYSDGSFVLAARKQGRTIRSWCDCKADGYVSGVGTGPSVAKDMAASLHLDGWAGEGESAAAFQRGYDAGGRVFVVNLSALNSTQIAKIAAGEVMVTAELYRNLQPNMTVDWRSANKGIGGNCIAVYASSNEGATAYSQDQYAARGELVRGVSVYCGGSPKPVYKNLP